MVRFLKFNSCESRFLLPVHEVWNWNWKTIFFDSFASNSGSNCSKIPHGTGIAILRNRNRTTSCDTKRMWTRARSSLHECHVEAASTTTLTDYPTLSLHLSLKSCRKLYTCKCVALVGKFWVRRISRAIAPQINNRSHSVNKYFKQRNGLIKT